MRIAVLISGNGSNLQALIDTKLSGEIVGVLSNKADAYGLIRAQNANIATCTISHQDFPTRDEFDQKMHDQLIVWNVDLVILAGFMRILTADFVQQWEGRMLNIHPSLLPAYKGVNTHQRVLNTGDRLHGCSVHFVTAELDAGQSIAQAALEVSHRDTPKSLAERIHHFEHFIYPQVVQWICTGQLKWKNHQVFFCDSLLKKPIRFTDWS